MMEADLALKLDGRAVTWVGSEGVWLAARAVLDGVSAAEQGYEAKWGPGRLRLLVEASLRERFDRQRAKWLIALWGGPLEAVRREGERVLRAWAALDAAAEAAGAGVAPLEVWEVVLQPAEGQDGRVLAVCRTDAMASLLVDRYRADPRHVEVWTIEEVARLLTAARMQVVADLKRTFPGALVARVSAPAPDPVGDLSGGDLDDPIPF